jgi:phosphinothricin acetyltransferase
VKTGLDFQIDSMASADWPAVLAIYEQGIATGVGTFETSLPTWKEWDSARFPHSRLVARADEVIGWAALSPVSKRPCYAGVAEVGIYIADYARRMGVGRALLEALIRSSESNGIWTLQGATISENHASLALQLACGFRMVGRREKIGRLDGVWRSTVLTERRSTVVGVK